jgi:hypothetical protein
MKISLENKAATTVLHLPLVSYSTGSHLLPLYSKKRSGNQPEQGSHLHQAKEVGHLNREVPTEEKITNHSRSLAAWENQYNRPIKT